VSGVESLLAGRFRVVRRLGAGGVASVFLAEDCVLRRLVALKELHPGAGADLAAGFRREMRLSASLSHPNIVRLLDAIVEGDRVLLIMEYVEGQTLAQRLRTGPIAQDEALGILEPLAGALDYVHARGVVHRDLKPANVLLDRAGRVKLADLGLAVAAEASGLTTSGIVLGTPAYMAPEQFEGRRATKAADIYSLAAVAFELFAGRRARPGATVAEMALRATREPPPRLREVRGDAQELADVLARGMARDPAKRPSSAGALVAQLRAALARDRERTAVATAPLPPVTAKTRPAPAELAGHPSPRRPRRAPLQPTLDRPAPPRPAHRRRRLLQALLIAVMALAAGAIVALVLATGRPRSERAARPLAQSTRSAAATRRATATRSARTTPSHTAPSTTGRSTSPATPATPSSTARSTPSSRPQQAPPAPAPSPAAGPTPATPEGAVRAFYTRAAAHRYQDAWALAAPGLRNQLQGFSAFTAQFASVRSIRFRRAQTIRRAAGAATVAIATTATHTDRIDHCAGTAQTARAPGGGWQVSHLTISC
jgi:serine/threonine protein kinase